MVFGKAKTQQGRTGTSLIGKAAVALKTHKQVVIKGDGFFIPTLKGGLQCFKLLLGLDKLCALGYPVLAGLSRKSMIYKLLGVSASDSATLEGTKILNYQALCQGATILRVHDVREAVEVVNMVGNNAK